MAFFGPQPLIGNDILDIGSRKAEMRARRQRGLVSEELSLGIPGQFDVPNVSDVSQQTSEELRKGFFLTQPLFLIFYYLACSLLSQ